MAGQSKGHGSHGEHGGVDPTEWMVENMGGIIAPVGKSVVWIVEKSLVLVIGGVMKRIGFLYILLFSPLLIFEFFVQSFLK